MAEHVYFLSLVLMFGTILLVVGMRSFVGLQQAKARLAHEDAYRKLAETTSASEVRAADALAAIEASLAEVKARLGAIEKVLTDVG